MPITINSATQEVGISNYEISKEFVAVIEIYQWDEVVKAIKQSMELLENAWQLKEYIVAKGIEEVYQDNTSILTYNNKNSLSCVIILAYYSTKEYYNIFRELLTGKGFADIIMIPNDKYLDKYAIIVKLKFNKDVDIEIDQIINRDYTDSLK